MAQNVFLDIGVIIIVATLVALLAKRFKQPMIPAYIVAGLIIGPGVTFFANLPFITNLFHIPVGFSVISNHELITTLSEVGIALLLFIVGLEINLKGFKEVDKVTSYGAMINILLLIGIGFFMSVAFGFRGVEAIYLSFIFVFGSTMVIIKSLSDKKDLESLHGKIIIGFLLVEDLVAILALFVLTTISDFTFSVLFVSLFIATITIVVLVLLSDFLLPRVFKFVADSKDLLFLTALGVCFLFSIVFHRIGFSIVIGSFMAGIIIGNLPYNYEIIGRIRSLRDFFSTLFFVSLGMQLQLEGLMGFMPFFIASLLIITFLKPFLTMLIVGSFGYRKYTSFKVGTSLAQVSEFSLILISQGMVLGFVSREAFSLVVMLAIVTIIITTYVMDRQLSLYRKIGHMLGFIEASEHLHKTKHHYKKQNSDIILCGCDRIGRSILTKLMAEKTYPLVVDYNPRIVSKLKEQGVPVMYGDITNEEIVEHLDFKKVKVLINTIRNVETSLLLIKEAKRLNKKILIIDCANKISEALLLYEQGADYVILPNFLGGDYISFLLGNGNLGKLSRKRREHIKELNKHKDHFLEDRHISDELHHSHY